MQSYSPKDPLEKIVLSMDFTRVLASGETISSATWLLSRTDTSEDTSSMLVGAADISSAPIVRQVIQGGTNNGSYLHRPQITTSLGYVLTASARQDVLTGA